MAEKIGTQDTNKDVESGKPVQLDEEHEREPAKRQERPDQPRPAQTDPDR